MEAKIYFIPLTTLCIISLWLLPRAETRGEKSLCSVSDEQDEVIVSILRSDMDKQVKQRTKLENTVIRKGYRWLSKKHTLTLCTSGTTIYVDGRRLLRTSEVKHAINVVNKQSKESGIRKTTMHMLYLF